MKRKLKHMLAAALMASMIFSTVDVLAITENDMVTIVTPPADHDYSENLSNLPLLKLKTDMDVEEGARFIVDITTAEWTLDDASPGALSRYFTKNSSSYTSAGSLSTQSGFTYDLMVLSETQVQITTNAKLNTDETLYIPLIVKMKGLAEATVSVSYGDTYGITSGTYIFANRGLVQSARLDFDGSASAEGERITGDITIDASGVIATTSMTLEAPDGFSFSNMNKENLSFSGTGGFDNPRLKSVSFNRDQTIMTLQVDVRGNSKSGTLKIKDIALNASDAADSGLVKLYFTGLGVTSEAVEFFDYQKPQTTPEIPAEQPPVEPQPLFPTDTAPTPPAPEAQTKTTTVSATAGSLSILVNGVASELAIAPYNDAYGRMMVPLRFISTAFGISESDITWDAETKTATISVLKDGQREDISFTIDARAYKVNGKEIPMDTAAGIANDYTFIPVRYAADALGVSVSYDAATKTALFTKTEIVSAN